MSAAAATFEKVFLQLLELGEGVFVRLSAEQVMLGQQFALRRIPSFRRQLKRGAEFRVSTRMKRIICREW